jgi:hypothetical protein
MKKKLEKYWKKNILNFKSACDQVNYSYAGVWPTEAFLLCSVFDLLNVDLILESGTGNGYSTEIMANYLDKQIITIDLEFNQWDAFERTSKRLSEYKNVKCIKGNGEIFLPKFINDNKSKNIGIFIDGPKGPSARDLGNNLFHNSNVSCICYHDQFIDNNYDMDGTLFNSSCDGDLGFINKTYGYLNDQLPEEQKKSFYPNGPGLSLQLK